MNDVITKSRRENRAKVIPFDITVVNFIRSILMPNLEVARASGKIYNYGAFFSSNKRAFRSFWHLFSLDLFVCSSLV